MNEEQRLEQSQINPVQSENKLSEKDNIERIKQMSSDDMIAKYFQSNYQPPDLKKARKRRREEVQFHYDFKIPEEMQTIGQGKKFLIRTYGCQMNEHATE